MSENERRVARELCELADAYREAVEENERLRARLEILREVFAVCEVEDDRGGWRIGGAHLQDRVREALGPGEEASHG